MKLNLKKLTGIGLAVILAISGGGCFGNSIFNPVEIVYAADTQLAIDYQFDIAGDFSEGLAPVFNEDLGKHGYIDEKGNLVIDYQLNGAWGFSEGLAVVYKYNDDYVYYGNSTYGNVYDTSYGYIDTTGELVIDYQFERAGSFSEGLACVRNSDGKYGYIDKTGELVIDYQFESAGDFSEGLATVGKIVNTYNDAYGIYDWSYGYIDTTGELVIDYQFDSAYNFSEGLAYVYNEELNKWGYIDRTGKLVTDYQFEFAHNFSEGLIPVYNEDLRKWGYMDTTFNLVIDYQFDVTHGFSEGLAKVYNRELEKYGYIDTTGNLVVDYQFYSYDYEGYFSNGFAKVMNSNGKWGYISKESIEASRISVTLDGEKIAFSQDPVIENGYTLVPMRTIFEKLGASLEWDANTKTVTATKGGTVIKLTVGSNVATVNGNSYNLDVSPKILNGTTLVPVRFVSEQLNVNVEWDANTKTVTMTSK